MKNRFGTRAGALALAALMTLSAAAPALAAEADYDEAYYATLDYYGGLTEGSVVKSYKLRGGGELVDYGVYDSVENLTDAGLPSLSDGKVVFSPEDGSGRFYFEGKTAQPYSDLPWSISLSYKLNGVPTPAEELAGEKGLVEICLDVLPNAKAPAYSRDNLVLAAATAFNADDILSLEAEGAEVQLVGNLRSVLYMVLPGEEQHFVIRVGTESFTFAGMMLLAVPATLQQLEQIADLKEAKEKGEDSLDAISDSLDVILDTLEGMTGSLNATASGLDQLNAARASVSARKDPVYDKADLALSDLDALAGRLGSLDSYAGTVSRATTELVDALDGLNGSVQSLRPELAETRKTIAALQDDAADLKELLKDVESYNKRSTDIAGSLANLTDDLEDEMEGLRFSLDRLQWALEDVKGVSTLSSADVLGMLPADQAAQMKTVLKLHGQYEDYLHENGLSTGALSFEDFIIAAAYKQYCEAFVKQYVEAAVQQAIQANPSLAGDAAALAAVQSQAAAQAQAALPTQADFVQNTTQGQSAAAQAAAASAAYAEFSAQTPMVDTVNKKIDEINRLVTGITRPTAGLVEELSDLCETVGDTGITDDLSSLAALCRDLLKTMKEHEGEGAALLDDLDEAGDLLSRLTGTAETILTQVDGLTAVADAYEPDVHSAVADVQALSGSLQSTLRDTRQALVSAEELLRSTGPQLDAGTQQSLAGLSAALRKANEGLAQTGTIREAKTTIHDLVDDEWNAHSGEVDGLLNMDAAAVPVSMTDPRNAAPQSVQYVMRTREIKLPEESGSAGAPQEQVQETTFWGRVAAMFRDLWAGFKALLHLG